MESTPYTPPPPQYHRHHPPPPPPPPPPPLVKIIYILYKIIFILSLSLKACENCCKYFVCLFGLNMLKCAMDIMILPNWQKCTCMSNKEYLWPWKTQKCLHLKNPLCVHLKNPLDFFEKRMGLSPGSRFLFVTIMSTYRWQT